MPIAIGGYMIYNIDTMKRKEVINMTTTYEVYANDKKNFFEKHDYNYTINTSSMDKYGRYTKTYNFEDGAVWSELMSPETIEQEIEVKFLKVKVNVELFKTEYWSTESASKYYYEKY